MGVVFSYFKESVLLVDTWVNLHIKDLLYCYTECRVVYSGEGSVVGFEDAILLFSRK